MLKYFVKQFKKGKLKMFFVFLALALFFWVLTKYSKEYTATVNATIIFNNPPGNTSIINTRSSDISFDLTANGFEFLYFKFKRPLLNIDINKYYTKNGNDISISRGELIKIINYHLKNDISVKNVSVNELVIELDSIIFKKIPVIIQTDITFRDGYKSIGKIRIDPDSVLVSGPSKSIQEINQIKTNILSLLDVNTNILENIALQTPESLDITISPQNVTISHIVEEFTQKSLILPLKVYNLAKGLKIKLIPEFITITFDVTVNEFNNFSKKDFVLICDYTKRDKNENFMIPELLEKPESILNIVIETKKVDYLIFK